MLRWDVQIGPRQGRGKADHVWSDSENAAKILEDLQEGNEDLYRFEKMLEAD